MNQDYESLKLENQLCFPLYACAKEVVKKYKPFLDPLGLTYTQYIVLMVLWEYGKITVRELGEKLYLDSGTLTPVLKNLESKSYLVRERSKDDERCVKICLTEAGVALKDKVVDVPGKVGGCVKLSKEEAVELYKLLYKTLNGIEG